MSPVVYFAQPKGGGPIKVGTSANPVARIQGLDGWSPSGIEMLTSIPGSMVRESALKWLFRERLWNASEWFAPDVRIWRVIAEATDRGDLAWLPEEREWMADSSRGVAPGLVREAIAFFGSREGVASALGYKVASLGTVHADYRLPRSFYGRFEMAKRVYRGEVPSYLRLPASAEVSADAA